MQCEHKNGSNRCRAHARVDSRYCFFHDPKSKSALKQATQIGGKTRATTRKVLPSSTPYTQLRSADDTRELVSQTIHDVRTGKVDIRVGNAIGFLAGILLKAIDQGDVETRLAVIEERLGIRDESDVLPTNVEGDYESQVADSTN